MSYPIKPDYRFNVSTPIKEGTKTLKIELFQVAQFKRMWSMDTRHDFLPRLPFRPDDRNIFWESEFFRVRVGGCWYMEKENYVFFTKEEVLRRWVF